MSKRQQDEPEQDPLVLKIRKNVSDRDDYISGLPQMPSISGISGLITSMEADLGESTEHNPKEYRDMFDEHEFLPCTKDPWFNSVVAWYDAIKKTRHPYSGIHKLLFEGSKTAIKDALEKEWLARHRTSSVCLWKVRAVDGRNVEYFTVKILTE